MTDAPATDKEVLRVVRDATSAFAQEQRGKHARNVYGLPAEEAAKHVERWEYIERRAAELIGEAIRSA